MKNKMISRIIFDEGDDFLKFMKIIIDFDHSTIDVHFDNEHLYRDPKKITIY